MVKKRRQKKKNEEGYRFLQRGCRLRAYVYSFLFLRADSLPILPH